MIENKSNALEDFPVFKPLDSSKLKKMVDESVVELLSGITDILDLENDPKISVERETMEEIITKVEQRRVYFHIYHNIEMGELNEASLICFWILKLMPFKHNVISNSTLNTRIACLFLIKTLYYVAKQTNKEIKIDKSLMEHLFYAFKYRDLSKEAIMALAETLIY